MRIQHFADSAPAFDFVSSPRLAIIFSRFNQEITLSLCEGAVSWLSKQQVTIEEDDIFPAPGTFELPLLAQSLAETGYYDGVICLGCVIKGDTAHFEFISLGATVGIQQTSLKTGVPIAFGILTTYTYEQAVKRSRQDAENKGKEAASACLNTLSVLQHIKKRFH